MTADSVIRFARSTTGRLAMTYLGIIMLMSIGFSLVFYNTSAGQLGRQLPPSSVFNRPTSTFPGASPIADRAEVEAFLQQRITEGRDALRIRLLGLNVLALLGGGALSYMLARRTLKPIEEAMEAQSQFIGDASHELKTPLTAIKTSNEVALRKPKLSLPEAKEIIKQNTEDVSKLQALTDGLLRLVNNKDSDHSLKPLPLQEIAAEAMNQVVLLAQNKDISVNDQVPNIKVLGNQQSLTQSITILLDNAIKYSEPNTVITLSGSSNAKFGYLMVSDQGIGIRAADLPHIFKRFYRADRSRNKQQYDGYGLGLSIADKLVKQQQGEISVDSTPGHGATFTIKLPLA